MKGESCFISRVFESYKDAQIPRDHRVLQDRQVAQGGCGITTYSESNAGSIRRQLNVADLKIISGGVILFANPPPFHTLKARGGNNLWNYY